MRSTLGLILSLFFLAAPAHAREVAQISVPDSVQLGPASLSLNGAGVRKKAFISVYVAALYTATKQTDAAAIVAGKEPKRMSLHFLRDVEAKKIHAAWREGFEANLPAAELAAMTDAIDRFVAAFPDMKKGDTVWIDALPDVGLRLTINDAPKASYRGDAFIQAVFKIWLGDKPVQDRLKKELLGQ